MAAVDREWLQPAELFHCPTGYGRGMHELLLHYSTVADWERSLAAGEHTISGRGMTLQREGFIHCCTAAQRDGVWQRFWSDVDEPLVLLQIDPALLPYDVTWEGPAHTAGAGPSKQEPARFPHLYAPLPVSAVVGAAVVDLGTGLPARSGGSEQVHGAGHQ